MKTSLSLVLIVTAASTLAACSSDDEGATRGNGGTGITAGAGGAPSGGAGGAPSGGAAGTPSGGAGGAAPVTYNYGTALAITAPASDVGNVVDPTTATGINGGAFFTQSENMTVDAAVAHRDGGLCFSGTTAVVPDANSYGTYWGAELGLNLKLIPDPAAPAPSAAADAGAGDAGAAIPLIPDPAGWPYGNVIGFSYKLVGNNAAAADQGVPAARIRFKALPVGSDGMNDNYCKDLIGTVDDGVVNVLFSEITFECWTAGNPSIGPAATTINVVDVGPPRVVTTPANPKALQNISWQIASDVVTTTPAPIAFDFCITDLKPILATP
jgi:hypothetical protein